MEIIDGRAVQVGLLSHGSGSLFLYRLGRNCGTFGSMMYTKVSVFIDWIDAVIKAFESINKITPLMMTTSEAGKPFKFIEMDEESAEKLLNWA